VLAKIEFGLPLVPFKPKQARSASSTADRNHGSGAKLVNAVKVKLKYALPLAQMALAVVLLWRSQLWMTTAARLNDVPGPAPPFTLLMSMNPPVALVHGLVYWHFSPLWELGVSVATIGFFGTGSR
jgi:hypothetical protein